MGVSFFTVCEGTPAVGAELPPGGVPTEAEPAETASRGAEAARQQRLLEELPAQTADALQELSIGAAKGLAALALEGPCTVIDTLVLPAWSVADTADRSLQFFQSGALLAARYGPVAFTSRPRIPLPPVFSETVREVETGMPSLVGDGKAAAWEHFAKLIPPFSLAYAGEAAARTLTSGDLQEAGALAAGVGVGIFLASRVPRPALPRVGLAQAAQPSESHIARAAGPLRAPREPGVRLPSARTPMDEIGQPQRDWRIAAIDDEMGGGDDGVPLAPSDKRNGKGKGTKTPVDVEHIIDRAIDLFDISREEAAKIVRLKREALDTEMQRAQLPGVHSHVDGLDAFLLDQPEVNMRVLGISADSSPAALMLRFGWNRDQLQAAIMRNDPRLAGTQVIDPISKSPLLSSIVEDSARFHMQYDELELARLPELEGLVEETHLPHPITPVNDNAVPVPEDIALRLAAAKQGEPEVLAYIRAMRDAGLNEVASLALQGLSTLRTYIAIHGRPRRP